MIYLYLGSGKMNSNKKSFISGTALGVVAALVVCIGVNSFNAEVNGAGGNVTASSKTEFIRQLIDRYYIDDVDESVIEEGIYKGMLEALNDPYSMYFNEEEFKMFTTDSDASFGGIGVTVMANTEDNTILVVSVTEGSPSEKAGILPGDKIIKAEGTDVEGNNLDKAVSIMRGELGTDVTVTIYRETTKETLDFTMKRELIEIPTVDYKMLDNQIGYIQLTSFDGVSYTQFKNAYDTLTQAGQKALIVDLRFNGGGRLDIAEDIADLLIPEGPIVYLEDKTNAEGKVVNSVSDANCVQVPLVMLVNGYSASASEVLTGAVKDYKVGAVVGTTTFGKGIVQTVIPISDGTGVKITTGKYYTPSGVCIHGTGIEPDYKIEMPEELKNTVGVPYEQDVQLQKAVEVLMGQINK